MTDSNRLRVTSIREQTLGVTPSPSPRMRIATLTGEGLQFLANYSNSNRIRDDRMNDDPSKDNETNQGPINDEFSFPEADSPRSDWYESMMFNPWVNTPTRFNDGVADSQITGVTGSTGVVTVLTGAAFVLGQLVRLSGFGVAANNKLAKITTGSATVPAVGAGAALEDEAAPAAAARMKVVGFEGASGDITAAADGLASTTLDFTTLGIAIGMWLKIGGTGDDYRFGVEALNGWARVIAVAAHKITLDNLPTGWETNDGSGKTIRVFFGDYIKNGVTMYSQTIERRFMGQAVPNSIIQRGMVVGQYQINLASEQKITEVYTFTGMTGELNPTSLDSTPDAASTARVMSAAVNVGRIAENGVALSGPNFVRSFELRVNNNLRAKPAIRNDDKVGPVDIGTGDNLVEFTAETYFGNSDLLTKYYAGTPTNFNVRAAKDSQAIVWALPRVTFTQGNPNASGKNQDVNLPLQGTASKDPLTGCQLLVNRLEYFEA